MTSPMCLRPIVNVFPDQRVSSHLMAARLVVATCFDMNTSIKICLSFTFGIKPK